MTGNVRQTAQELTWGTLRVTCDNSPTDDGTEPQNGSEGTEGMKSIDNLREYVLTAPSVCSTTRAILVGYIDGVEREVEEVRDREYRNGMEDGEMAAERDGWVRLPVDADGEPIHAMDMLDGYGKTIEVVEMRYGRSGWVLISRDGNGYADTFAFSHHHAPTVEDVLREFADLVRNEQVERAQISDETVAEYAAKLRLAGDAE